MHRLLGFLLLLGLSACLGAQAPPPSSASLPVSRPWLGLPQVPVTVNGGYRANFIVDSAASGTVLTPRMIGRLGLEGRGERATVSGSTGNASSRFYRLSTLRVGPYLYRRVGAYGLPPDAAPVEADGLLGADTLRRHVVEFDMPRGRMTLHSRMTDLARQRGWSIIPAGEQPNGFLIVQVRIGGLTMPAIVDTGAVQNFMNHEAARRLGLRFVPGSDSISPITGATGHIQEYNQLEVSRFSIGDIEFGASRMGVADLALFDAMELSGGPAMLLSAESLGNRRFVLDYPRDRLLIERAPN